ncbi:PIN2/TERF1-interacting telomerase inhibitor 1 [Drosophila navojoa]|uniref:PIN2/TERF1-interacting telomerase inhibitor 1 n=1 Tax=Drosophila navojoa TaxID=7232 RepID=UPI000846D681|nr:PIN2/TERF1-interacting telomerase inhibitor 1 [Drosophila navojoa]
MAMLAEPRRRKRYNLCPRGKALYEDDTRFGTKMLEKMGWTKGRGLGANEDGAQDFVRLRFKKDSKGLGFEARDDQWTTHDENFNGLLKTLHGGEDNGNASESEEEARPMGFGFKAEVAAAEEAKPNKLKEKLTGISLEEKSKQSKARVHYKKFTRGKDLAQYSEKDLANIFGKKVTEETEIPVQIKKQEVVQEKPVNPNFGGLCTISTGVSVNDYFKQKMEAMKQKPAQNKNVENTSMNGTANEIANGDANVEEAPIKKKKKKKDKNKEKEQEIVETEVPAEAVPEEPSKKKKKSKRAAEENANEEKEEPETEASNQPKRKKKKKDKEEMVACSEVASAEEEPKKKKKKSKRNEETSVETEVSEKSAKKKNKKNVELTEEPKLTEPVPDKSEDSKIEDNEENEVESKGETPQEKTEKPAKKKSKKSKKEDREEPQLQDETKSMTSNAPNGDDLANNHTTTEQSELANEKEPETEVSEDEADNRGKRYLSMKHLLSWKNSFNVFTISSFCAEKFHILDMGAFKNSSLSEIAGYSFDENIQVSVMEIPSDAVRIMSLWEGRRSKYSQKTDVERTRIMVKKLKYQRITTSHLKKLNKCNAFSGL